MISLIEHYREMARNNAYSNAHLLRACCNLTDEAFGAARASFFPSLAATLNHILIVDRFYIAGLRGETADYSFFENELPFPQARRLCAEQEKSDRALIELCDCWQEADLDRAVRLDRAADGIFIERVGTVLPHLFVHQIHHRGQAHAMLAGTEVPPPQLDEFFLLQSRPLRDADEKAFNSRV